MDKPSVNFKFDNDIFQLLRRCSSIEGRTIIDIVNSLVEPYLAKYRFNSLEEWESAREVMEMQNVMRDFDNNENFDPNHIPFDTQVIGLRRKLDELDREIKSSTTPDDKLQELRFSLVEQLNFAETETLKKQREKRVEQIKIWEQTCKDIPL